MVEAIKRKQKQKDLDHILKKRLIVGTHAHQKKEVEIMTDKKPTDSEIVKALECCVSEQYTCRDCPYQEIKHYSDDEGFEIMPNGKRYDDWSCERWLNVDLLDLINRLQANVENYKQIAENQQKIILDKAFENKKLKAEIERLTKSVTTLTKSISELTDEVERQKKAKDESFLFAANIIEAEKTVIAETKAEAYKECIEKVKEEIKQALESNYKARNEREKKEINLYLDDLFWNYCSGKIDCLRGLDDFLGNLLKELVGEDNG